MSGEQLLDDQGVATKLGMSRATVWRMVQRGDLPQPFALTARSRRWRESTIDAYIDSLDPQTASTEEAEHAYAT